MRSFGRHLETYPLRVVAVSGKPTTQDTEGIAEGIRRMLSKDLHGVSVPVPEGKSFMQECIDEGRRLEREEMLAFCKWMHDKIIRENTKGVDNYLKEYERRKE